MTTHQLQSGESGDIATPDRAPTLYSPITELRQYTLHPGQRDTLIDLFEQEFIESQEDVGIVVIGQFRDVGDPNRFVWLRGFPDMFARKESLQAFYGGPVWREHRDAANTTMVDSDNVLLLHPAHATAGFRLDTMRRPPRDTAALPTGLVVTTTLSFAAQPGADFLETFERALTPILAQNGASILSSFVTEESVNTFPALPVREGEHVFVWFARFDNQAAYEAHCATLEQSPEWRERWASVVSLLKTPPQVLLLAPTARSLVR